MRLLIDAYNVLHLAHRLPDHLSVLNTTDLCALLSQANLGPAAVVCDGAPKPDEHPHAFEGPVRMIHAGKGNDADSLIETMLAEDPAARDLTVVSNDRRIQAAAKRKKANLLSSQDFLKTLADALNRPRPDPRPVDPALGDSEHWLEKFGMADDTTRPSSPQNTCETEQWLRAFGFEDEPKDED